MPKHNTRYSCMEKPRVNQFCSQCYCMRLPWPQSWYPVLDEWTIHELILGHCIFFYTEILFQDVPRASRVQPEMIYETSTVAFSNIVSNWKLEFWMFLRSYSPRLVFMSFNPYKLSPKKNYTPVQLSILSTLNQNATNWYCFNMIFHITPAKTQHYNDNSRIWRCISHWTWGFSNVILVFRDVITRGGSNDAFQHGHHGISTGKASGDDSVGLLPTKERQVGLQQMFTAIIYSICPGTDWQYIQYIYIHKLLIYIYIYSYLHDMS